MADPRPRRLVLAARAKINLGLEILGKRRDGYHEIRSLMQSITLADRIEITSLTADRMRMVCPDSDLPENEQNLVLRAAVLLREHTGVRAGARLVLRKQIPIGSGLGGGSSDAAATLVGLNRVWGLRLPHRELIRIGSRLGSDVPFFIRGGTQLAEGRGERLTRLPSLPRLPVVILFPSVAVSTASIYGDRRIPLTVPGGLSRLDPCDLATHSGIVSYVSRLRNDLDLDVVRVTGSGSSVFLLCEDKEVLRRAFGKAARSDCQVFWTWFAARGWHSVGS